MAEVATAYVSLMASARGITPSISKALDGPAQAAGRQAGGKAGTGFKSRFGGALRGIMAPLAAAFAGVQVARFFGDSITAASGLEESINALNVSYGDASEGVQALGKNAANSLGLSNLEFNNLAVRFSSFSKTIAGDGGDVVGTLDDLTGRAADFASVMNLDVAEAARLFQSGLAGESEPLRQFGIDMSAAAVTAFALENGIADSASSMTEAQKVQARYGLIMQQTSATQGDFANTSDSLANKQRILGARFEDFKTTIGSALLPVMSSFVGFLTDKVLPGVESLAAGLGPFAAKVAAWKVPILAVVGVITAVFLPALIAMGVQHTIAAAKAAAAWLVMQWSAIRGAAAQTVAAVRVVAGWVLMGVQSMIQAVRMAAAWFIALGPVGWVIAIVIGLAALIIANWDKIVDWTKKAWTNVTAWLSKAWANIKTTASNVWNAILNFFKAIPGKIVQFFLNFTLPGLMIKHWASIKDGAVRGWNAVISFIKGVPGKIVAGIGNLGRLLYNAGRQVLDGLTSGIRDTVGRAVQAVKDAVGSVISGAKNLLGIASPSKVFQGFGENIGEGLRLGIDSQQRLVQSSVDSLTPNPRALNANLKELGGAVYAGQPLAGAVELGPRTIHALGSEQARVMLAGSRTVVADSSRAQALAGRPR